VPANTPRRIFIRTLRWFVSLSVSLSSVLQFLFRACRRILWAAAVLLPAHSGLVVRAETPAPRPALLVAYFGQWSLENDPPFYLKQLVTNGSAARLDQLNYSQASVKGGQCSIADPKADLNQAYGRENSVSGKPDRPDSPFRGYFHQLKELKQRYPHLKVVISLGMPDRKTGEPLLLPA